MHILQIISSLQILQVQHNFALRFVRSNMIFPSFVHPVLLYLCFFFSLGISTLNAIPLLQDSNGLTSHGSQPKTAVSYPQKPLNDLIPLYFFTCEATAVLVANGKGLKEITPYGTAFRFALPIQKPSVDASTSRKVSRYRYLLYDPNHGIPSLARPDTCLQNYAVVKFNLAHPDTEYPKKSIAFLSIEDLAGIPELSHKVQAHKDKPSHLENRDVIMLIELKQVYSPYEKDKNITLHANQHK
ncbi:hypothetical protein F5876DRAFT_70164 [Lentinula aff. lateritia]|uniref:Uncharacterized protein n=1 Tax=Lentinula aff. lateritia TaxID=2804960 RepID=A0ACC1TK76_9AGAR|nr:hypothetical protein F5876DRAFT_70164 [Lentinula aff. lateritia]